MSTHIRVVSLPVEQYAIVVRGRLAESVPAALERAARLVRDRNFNAPGGPVLLDILVQMEETEDEFNGSNAECVVTLYTTED